MTMPPAGAIRSRARRDQIVQAARECIAQGGIHGATMAQIATRAGLGVGQVYRLFDSKSAIVDTIANDDLAETRALLAAAKDDPQSVLEGICALVPKAVDRCFDPERLALKVEFAAEAARNPTVAAVLREADGKGRKDFEAALEGLTGQGGDSPTFEARCQCVYVLFDGLAIRALQQPDANRPALVRLLQGAIRQLFS